MPNAEAATIIGIAHPMTTIALKVLTVVIGGLVIAGVSCSRSPTRATGQSPAATARRVLSQANFQASWPLPRWEFVTFEDIGSVPANIFFCAGPTPTNMTIVPSVVYTDPNGNSVRDPSICRYNGQYLLAYNTYCSNPTNGYGIATSMDGLHFNYVGMMSFGVNLTNQWAPEWFIDPTNGLHLLGYVGGTNRYNGTIEIADVSATNLTTAANVRAISGVNRRKSSDPVEIYNKGYYYIFTSLYEYVSTAIDGGFTRLHISSTTSEGSTVFYFAGKWWWVKSNNPGSVDTYSTSTDLTNWTADASAPWMPAGNGIYGITTFDQGTIVYFDATQYGNFTGNGSGLTNSLNGALAADTNSLASLKQAAVIAAAQAQAAINARFSRNGIGYGLTSLNSTSLTGALPTANLPGITTNVSASGLTSFITNGLIMRVSSP
jgi:hypothetical protein